MIEYSTKGIVLDRNPRGEEDERVLVYTKDLGKIMARVESSKRIVSKLSPHLEVGRFVDARLVRKDSYKLVDALSDRTHFDEEVLKFLNFVNLMTPYETQDLHLWQGLEYVLQNGLINSAGPDLNAKIYRRFLEILGFGAKYARCHNCESGQVSYFDPRDVIFLCSESLKRLNIHESDVVKI